MVSSQLTVSETERGSSFHSLADRNDAHSARVVIVELGYVGLPFAMTFGRAGFEVTGIDLDPSKVSALKSGRSYITDLADSEIRTAIEERRFTVTSDLNCISGLDSVSICVPTPLRKTKDPDLSFVISAVDAIASRLHPGQLIVLESTTYPGTTEEIALPRLLESGLHVGDDFFLAYSPERVPRQRQVHHEQHSQSRRRRYGSVRATGFTALRKSGLRCHDGLIHSSR